MIKKIMLLSSLVAVSALAGQWNVGVGVQNKSLGNSSLKYGDSTTSTSIKYKSDFGMDDEITFKPFVEYKTDSNKHLVGLSYENIDFSGTNDITRAIVFDGNTYNIGDRVSSSLKMDWWNVYYKYQLMDNNLVNIGADLNIIDTKVSLKSPLLNDSGSRVIPLPTLTLSGSYEFYKDVTIDYGVKGVTFGSYGSYVETDLGVSYHYNGWKFSAGYEYKKLSIDHEDIDATLKFDGMYGKVSYKF